MQNQYRQKEEPRELDVVVVGAGFAGMYLIKRLRETDLSFVVLEQGGDLGGTWYWNRYPGARCDVPSIEYSYSFDAQLQRDWDWSEIMAAQPEILDYANHVAERFDLRRDIEFNTKVLGAAYDPARQRWSITTDTPETISAQYCIMATGCLSVTNTPEIEGAEDFSGPVYHTGRWPQEGVDFSGVRVGIIGTGSSGIQSIPVIAEEAQHLTVFQRTPNYTMPAHNADLEDEYRAQVRANYVQIRAEQRESPAGIVSFQFGFGGGEFEEPTEMIVDTTAEERRALVEEHGFEALRRFADVNLSLEANELACEMYRHQVSRVIDDPEVAERLMPRDYPIGCKRPVIDTHYYETFNRDNVDLVDLRQNPLLRINETGVQTENGYYEFDALVYATGFDAMTGALSKVDIRGRDGTFLRDAWAAGPQTYLGLQSVGYPNLFMITGPGSPSVLSNMMVSIEQHVDWIMDCLGYMGERQLREIEPSGQAQDAWGAHVNEVAQGTMFTAPSCNSWYVGANIPGKARVIMPYVGGVGEYRRICDEIAAKDYDGFIFS
ncbi:MAG: NAD(P)/FAD-dependent oxidoreductase [Pseudomonadota bacterium]